MQGGGGCAHSESVSIKWRLIDGTGGSPAVVSPTFYHTFNLRTCFYIQEAPASIYSFCSIFQSKGRAVSRLLESFAADEGFQMDGSSFSEEEDDSSKSYEKKVPQRERRRRVSCRGEKREDGSIVCNLFLLLGAVPNCVLTKDLLTDGLKVLVSKEDELLYAARVHSLDLPDM